MKIADLVSKLAGGGLLFMSVGFFIGFADVGGGRALIPALACGAGGLWLFIRRDGPPMIPADLTGRMERLEGALAATQRELGAAHDELKQLSEERDFYRELRAPLPEAKT